MPFHRILLAGALSLTLGGQVLAQQSDLLGSWTAEATTLLEAEEKLTETPRELTFVHTLVIEAVDGQLVSGYRTWERQTDLPPGYIGDVPLNVAREPFIGTVSSDGKTIRLVETEDEGLIFCERIGADRIELTYMEAAPHALIFTAILERAQ